MQRSQMAKKMMNGILLLTLLSLVIAVLVYRSLAVLPFVYGLLMAVAVSLVKVLLLERAVNRALTMEKNKAGLYVSVQHLLRLALSVVPLLIAALVPAINLWGAVVGIFTYQLSLYILKFTEGKT